MFSDGMPFNGDTLKTESLGGTETAALQAAEMFAQYGHEVTILTNTNKPGNYNGVEYRNVNEFNKYFLEEPHDISLILRHPQLFAQPHNSQLNILWQHDLAFINDRETFLSNVWDIDDIWCQSNFHKKQYHEISGLPQDAFWVAGSAIDPSLLPKEMIERNSKKLVYTSRPERGLETLITNIMPRLLEYDRELELHITTYAGFAPQILSLISKLKDVSTPYKNNIVWHEPMTKKELYKLFKSAYLYLYPVTQFDDRIGNFEETYCLSADEAMVCGLPFISRPLGAIPETLHQDAGILIDGFGSNKDDDFCTAFSNEVIEVLKDRNKWNQMSEVGIKTALKEDTWKVRCRKFLERMESLNQTKIPSSRTLSACILVRKQDNPHLLRCLKTVEKIADEIIINVDEKIDKVNGTIGCNYSTYNSDNLENDIWNEMLDQTTGKWILWLYGSEEIQNPSGLLKYLRNNTYLGYTIPKEKASSTKDFSLFYDEMLDHPIRLFRRNTRKFPAIQFHGKIYPRPSLLREPAFYNGNSCYKGELKDVSIIDFSDNFDVDLDKERFILEKDTNTPNRKFFLMRNYFASILNELQNNGGTVTTEIKKNCREIIRLYCSSDPAFKMKRAILEMYSKSNQILNQGFDLAVSLRASRGSGAYSDNFIIRFASVEDAKHMLDQELEEKVSSLTNKYYLVR
jgi:glycosyltransferase involved in cell wall biosynthesis